jgi:hypothetical protein
MTIRNNVVLMSGRTASAQLLKDYVIEWLRQNFPEPGSKVITEHQFTPYRRWRFDVAVTPAKVGIEFQGAVFTGGHHTRGPGYVDDARKMLAAGAYGWMVLYIPVTLLREELQDTMNNLEAAIICRMDYITRAK